MLCYDKVVPRTTELLVTPLLPVALHWSVNTTRNNLYSSVKQPRRRRWFSSSCTASPRRGATARPARPREGSGSIHSRTIRSARIGWSQMIRRSISDRLARWNQVFDLGRMQLNVWLSLEKCVKLQHTEYAAASFLSLSYFGKRADCRFLIYRLL